MTARLGTALYTHYYGKEFPERFHDIMDSRRWTPGERIGTLEDYRGAEESLQMG